MNKDKDKDPGTKAVMSDSQEIDATIITGKSCSCLTATLHPPLNGRSPTSSASSSALSTNGPPPQRCRRAQHCLSARAGPSTTGQGLPNRRRSTRSSTLMGGQAIDVDGQPNAASRICCGAFSRQGRSPSSTWRTSGLPVPRQRHQPAMAHAAGNVDGQQPGTQTGGYAAVPQVPALTTTDGQPMADIQPRACGRVPLALLGALQWLGAM